MWMDWYFIQSITICPITISDKTAEIRRGSIGRCLDHFPAPQERPYLRRAAVPHTRPSVRFRDAVADIETERQRAHDPNQGVARPSLWHGRCFGDSWRPQVRNADLCSNICSTTSVTRFAAC